MEVDGLLDIWRGFEECQVVPDTLLKTGSESQKMPHKEGTLMMNAYSKISPNSYVSSFSSPRPCSFRALRIAALVK